MSKDTLNHHIHTFPSPYFLLNHQEHGFGVIEGTARANSSLLLEVTENRIVVADTDRKELLRVNEIIGEPLQQDTVLDRNGNSFEGCVNHNEPFGWGVLYDKDHNRMYEGFRIGESSSCFGTSFDPENHHVQYEGEYCNGKRWGRGTQYDKMGKVVFDGEWLNDERLERRVKIASHDDLFHTQIEELTIANGACNEDDWKTLDLTALSLLRRLVIGEDSFDKVKEVKTTGLAQLEEVTIGKNCFLNGGRGHLEPTSFALKDCPKVKTLTVGYQSFYLFGQCDLENLPSLEVIAVGGYCFQCCGEVRVAHLAALKKVSIGKNSFAQSTLNRGAFCLEDCPEVETLELGKGACYNALRCVVRDNPKLRRVVLKEACFHAATELTLSNVDGLTELHVGTRCFAAMPASKDVMRTLRLSHLPGLEEVTIQNGSFSFWGGLELEDLAALKQVTVGDACFALEPEKGSKEEKCPKGRFVLKDCPKVKKLEIGKTSFLSCGVCELSNLPALKSISIGSLKYADLQRGFPVASLELRSMVGWSVINRLAEAAKRAAGRLGVRHCEACGV